MKKNVLKIVCAVLALAMFAGVMPQTSVRAAAALKAPKAFNVAKLDGAVTLGWSEVKGAKGYFVYRSVNDGKFKKIYDMKKSETLISDEDSFADGTKLSYYVTAYKKADGKKVAGEKSKTVKITVAKKDKYASVKKAFAKYVKKNGEESPAGTYTVGSLTVDNGTALLGGSYIEEQDAIGFTYIGGDDAIVMLFLYYYPDSDPCFVYSISDGSKNAAMMFFINPSKITKKTKFKASDIIMSEDEFDGEIDHLANINTAAQEIFAYMKSATDKVDGVTMKKLGFKNYK
ncbi:MAG: hypothetical protein K5858_03955 [Lachnospiraceae bacterium]|nr:hypothetical protein [Lachnospiraceae bacterium]